MITSQNYLRPVTLSSKFIVTVIGRAHDGFLGNGIPRSRSCHLDRIIHTTDKRFHGD